ncbi:hypothetical protein [Bradyrhizobium manausense]|uniref:Uncharacterized protein n=1 Tax=Bradyrhizobium manausense TaxID=989370 RepID=A0A0R3DQP1_9BRAD|nr:hypothetical protein [Bradyrhizobium manausense]KRQ11969.1 hypothetical protein AOQ71_17265 [Bradyrhizobium manausense]
MWRIAEAIQGYLRKAGMDVQVEQQALSAWFASGMNGEYSMTTLQICYDAFFPRADTAFRVAGI